MHPQKWTDDIDYAGKRVVVIGSGATAVTLVPEMANEAAHVTMLQRSPTYVVSRPQQDRDRELAAAPPARRASRTASRAGRTCCSACCSSSSRARRRERMKNLILKARAQRARPRLRRRHALHAALQPVGSAHVPRARRRPVRVRSRRAAPRWSRIRSRRSRRRDCNLRSGTGARSRPDRHRHGTQPAGVRRHAGQRRRPRGRSGAHAELQGHDVQRRAQPRLGVRLHERVVDAEMRPDLRVRVPAAQLHGRARLSQCTPRRTDPSIIEQPWIDFSSGYVQRSIAAFPKQGSKSPWRLYQNYALDILTLRFGSIEDGTLEFAGARRRVEADLAQGESA